MAAHESSDRLAVLPAPARLSAVSQSLRAIRRDLAHEEHATRHPANEGFRVFGAGDLRSRDAAYRLAWEVYRQKGYAADAAARRLVDAYDARPETCTLLGEDTAGAPAGTVTLVFDAPAGLPCDAIFHEELSALRTRRRRLVEVSRLAIADRFRHARALLERMINLIMLHTRCTQGYDDFVIEVNPRHAGFYRRFLGFEVLGAERPCPRVGGAPAVLLGLDLAVFERAMREPDSAGERTLYPRFLRGAEAAAAAARLARELRPMTPGERTFFGLLPQCA
ncbi:MAG: GNAT family N-acetyltransferase [Planctomycetes bacterium]|nr:GNAT family N-acetyltransferase [Planctomycetota bacterium]